MTLNGRLAGKLQTAAALDRSLNSARNSPIAASDADATVLNSILRRDMVTAPAERASWSYAEFIRKAGDPDDRLRRTFF
jgi:hypothetical protein